METKSSSTILDPPFEETGPDEPSFTRVVPLSKRNHGLRSRQGFQKSAAIGALAALSFAVLIYFCFRSLASGQGGSSSPLMPTSSGVTPRLLMHGDRCPGERKRDAYAANAFEKSVLQLMYYMLDLCREVEAWGTSAAELPGNPFASEEDIKKHVLATKTLYTTAYVTSASVLLSDLMSIGRAANYLEAILFYMESPSIEFQKAAKKAIASLIQQMKCVPSKGAMRTAHHCGEEGKKVRAACYQALSDTTMVLNRVYDRLWSNVFLPAGQMPRTNEMLEVQANLRVAADNAVQLASQTVQFRKAITARTKQYLDEAATQVETDENHFWKAQGRNCHLVEALMHTCLVEAIRLVHETLTYSGVYATRQDVRQRTFEVIIVTLRRVSDFLRKVPRQGWRLQQVGPELASSFEKMFNTIMKEYERTSKDKEGERRLIERTKEEIQLLCDVFRGKAKSRDGSLWTAQQALDEIENIHIMLSTLRYFTHLISNRTNIILKHTYAYMERWEPDIVMELYDGITPAEAETRDREGDLTDGSDSARSTDSGTPEGDWRKDFTAVDDDSPRGAEGGATASGQEEAWAPDYGSGVEEQGYGWYGFDDLSSEQDLARGYEQVFDDQSTSYWTQQPFPPFIDQSYLSTPQIHPTQSPSASADPALRHPTPEDALASELMQTHLHPHAPLGPNVPTGIYWPPSMPRPPPGFHFTPRVAAYPLQDILQGPHSLMERYGSQSGATSDTTSSESSTLETPQRVSDDLHGSVGGPPDKAEQPSEESVQQPERSTMAPEGADDVSPQFTWPQQTSEASGPSPTQLFDPSDLWHPQFSMTELSDSLETPSAEASRPGALLLPLSDPQTQSKKVTIVLSDGTPVVLHAPKLAPERRPTAAKDESPAVPSALESKLAESDIPSEDRMSALESALGKLVEDESRDVQHTEMWPPPRPAPVASPGHSWTSRLPSYLHPATQPSTPTPAAPSDDAVSATPSVQAHLSPPPPLQPQPSLSPAMSAPDESRQETSRSLQASTSPPPPSHSVPEAQTYLYSLFPPTPDPWRQSLPSSRAPPTAHATGSRMVSGPQVGRDSVPSLASSGVLQSSESTATDGSNAESDDQ